MNLLGIREKVNLQINTLGNSELRKSYIVDLVKFFKQNNSKLSSESKKRLESNPLRILDSKNLDDQEIVKKSPILIDYLDKESKLFFEEIQNNLKNLKIKFSVNPYLVRGLDYYNHTAFEFVTFEDKSQNAILAGGRYDGLVSSLGGKNQSGVGWASGIERIILNLEKINIKKQIITLIALSDNLNCKLLKYFRFITSYKWSKLSLIYSGTLKKKLIKANKLGSIGCLILGEDEIKEKKIIWKNMNSGSQEKIEIENINQFLKKKMEN